MSDALLVSNLLLWVAVVALCGVTLALARQLGVLYERIAPAGALSIGQGPAVGDQAPVVRATTLAGDTIDVGAPAGDGRRTLIFFVSPTCPVCKTLLPTVRSIAREEAATLGLVLASDGPGPGHRELVRDHRLGDLPYVVSTDLGVAWKVPRLPYAVLLDGEGRVRSKGLVNTREHVESLLEADRRGVASIQEFLRAAGGTATDA